MRLVSLMPSVTDNLIVLGLTEQVVAADAQSLPLLGSPRATDLGAFENPRVEEIRAAKPDLVITSDTIPGAEAVIDTLREMDLPVLVLHTERFDDMLADLYTIGVECGAEARAREVVARLGERIRRLTSSAPARAKPVSAYVELWPDPFVSVGSQNWISDMLKKAGAQNLFADLVKPSFLAEEEEILERAPEVILLAWRGLGDDTSSFDIAPVLTRPGWANVPAVRAKRIYALPENRFLYPGPRLVEGLEYLINLLAV